MSVKSLPVEENEKNLEKDFSTVKSLDNISTQNEGKILFRLKACRNCSNDSFFNSVWAELWPWYVYAMP